mgnify:CR=1 FL=1
MKRLHVHVSVEAMEPAIAFYSALFDQQPTVAKSDYAKWEVDDPRVNLAISQRCGNAPGVNHLGIQAGDEAELGELHERLGRADIASLPEEGAHCCYATGNKHWAADPSAVIWEMFHTMGEAATYGEDSGPQPAVPASTHPTSGGCC